MKLAKAFPLRRGQRDQAVWRVTDQPRPLHSVDLSEGEGSTRSSVEARCRGQVVVEGLGNAC